MNWLKQIVARRRMAADLAEELRQHLEEKIEALTAGGTPREEAVHAARRAFGNPTLLEQRSREVWQWPLVESIWADIKFALRQLRKSPGFTVTVIATLALGIGANTAIFSLINGVLMRPLPFPEQNRLVWLSESVQPNGPATNGQHSIGSSRLSYPDFFDWRAKSHSFAAMASYRTDNFILTGHGDARELNGAVVSAGFFRVLGVAPALGRGFLRNEEQHGSFTVVLSHELWQSTFDSAPGIVGRDITLGGRSYRVAGVMPKGFVFPIQDPAPVLWSTLADDAADPDSPTTAQRGAHIINVIGRLKPGVSLAQAQADLSLIARNLSVQYPSSNKRFSPAIVQPELEHLIGNSQPALRVLFGAVMLVLLIACVNVAGLLLARATRRRPEIAVRAALGASRAMIFRQMLVESVFLACCGGALGLGLSIAMLRALLHFVPGNLPRMGQVSVDGPVLAFAMLASLLTGLLFGVLPAWRMSRLDPAVALHDGTRTVSGGRSQHRLHDWLVVTETAIALVLLVGSGLLIRSFVRVLQVDPGFDPNHVLTASLDLPDDRYSTQQHIQFYQQLLPRLVAQPGVQSAAAGWPLPLSGHQATVAFEIQGRPTPPGESPDGALSIVTPGYFQTLHIPVLRGRTFRATDNSQSTPAIIISQSFARKYFPGEDPIGKRMEPWIGDGVTKTSMREIIGVVGDVKRKGLTAGIDPQYYLPYAQAAIVSPTLVLRTAINPVSLIDPLHTQLASMDKNVPLYDVHTFESIAGKSAAQPRFQMLILTCFAAMALLLSAIGLYGVLSYMVVQRTLEIGVRMAMGAQRSDVLRLVLRRGLTLALMGLGIGLGFSVLLTRFIAGMLYGIRPFDPVTFIGVALVLLGVSMLASSVPAHRAASIDPMKALRSE